MEHSADDRQIVAQDGGEARPPRLLDQVRNAIRVRHYAYRTEQSYVDWIRRFIVFHGKRHPAQMGAAEVQGFLTYLAVERGVSTATQAQARSALLFLYREVLAVALPWMDEVVQARGQRRLPVVLTPHEVRVLLGEMSRQAMTSALCRSCWVMRTCAPRWSTGSCSTAVGAGYAARWMPS